MVRPAKLERESLNAMTAAFTAFPSVSTVRVAIGYLIEARRATFLDYSLLNTWTALETLVNGASAGDGSDKILDETVFSLLREALKGAVKSFSDEHGLASPNGDDALEKSKRVQIYDKLRELQRPSLVPRVIALLDRHRLDVERLWERDFPAKRQPLHRRLTDAYSRRSALIHQGKIDDPYTARGDYLRIHALTELLIYRMLGGDDEWLNPIGWGHLYRHDLFKPR
jgi:hypothetical protein